ncbi:MAG: glutamate 5-kinase [Chloroflexi bacterium]|nr:glutamate 5-kinase [Chloroflexota bacterium]
MSDQQPRRIICKLGTNLLTSGTDRLDPGVLEAVVRQVAELRNAGAQVAVVTSGAVTAGRARVGVTRTRSSVGARQALAAIGQAQLVQRYDSLLQRYGLTAAQALITRGDVTERRGYLNVRNTLLRLLQYGVVPIINENDVVADDELRGGAFGENDALSALIANLIDADLLILLSDVDGVYDRDPRGDEQAELIPVLRNPVSMMQAAGEVDERSRGGMRAKLEAARRASAGGTDVVIASGHEPNVISRIAGGERLGTLVPADTTVRDSRERWLLAGLHNGEGLDLDPGAVRALTRQGRSLLPAGVTKVRGQFERGDVIQLYSPEQVPIAVGISNYSSAETVRIQGKKSSEIIEALGYNYGSSVVHRNNLALLPQTDA